MFRLKTLNLVSLLIKIHGIYTFLSIPEFITQISLSSWHFQSRDLFVHMSNHPKNTIILTSRTVPGSLARKASSKVPCLLIFLIFVRHLLKLLFEPHNVKRFWNFLCLVIVRISWIFPKKVLFNLSDPFSRKIIFF